MKFRIWIGENARILAIIDESELHSLAVRHIEEAELQRAALFSGHVHKAALDAGERTVGGNADRAGLEAGEALRQRERETALNAGEVPGLRNQRELVPCTSPASAYGPS
ncbi:MAG: hypothetical protein V8T86_05855 [Victivallis sp.]